MATSAMMSTVPMDIEHPHLHPHPHHPSAIAPRRLEHEDTELQRDPEVTTLSQERDPDDGDLGTLSNPHSHPQMQHRPHDPNRKWSPLTTFWNEMGDDKPPSKKRKVGPNQSEDEFDELEEEEPSGVQPSRPRHKYSEGSQSPPVDGDSATTLNGGMLPVKRECTRCIRSGTPCVVGTGASCMRCRAMHQSCSLVAGRSSDGKDVTAKAPKSDGRPAHNGISLRRRSGEGEDIPEDTKRRRSDDPPTTIGSRSPSPTRALSPHEPRHRPRSPDLDEIIELAAGSAGQLGPSSSSVLPRARKRNLSGGNNSTTNPLQRNRSLKRLAASESGRVNLNTEEIGTSHSRSSRPPSRVMKALLMTSRAGRLYSEAIEELSMFIEEQRYL